MRKITIFIIMSIMFIFILCSVTYASNEDIQKLLTIYNLSFKQVDNILNGEDINKIIKNTDYVSVTTDVNGQLSVSLSKEKTGEKLNYEIAEDGTLNYQYFTITPFEYEMLTNVDFIKGIFEKEEINEQIKEYYWFNRTNQLIECVVETDSSLYWIHILYSIKYFDNKYTYEVKDTKVDLLSNYVKEGKLVLNDVEIEEGNFPIFYGSEALFPLRIIFEKLGAEVIWNNSNRNVAVKYVGKEYLFKLYTEEDVDTITVQNENLNNGALGDAIQLGVMSAVGSYKMINDRIYLYEDTARRLFETLGFMVEIDHDNYVIDMHVI